MGNPPPYDYEIPGFSNGTGLSNDLRKGFLWGPPEDMYKLAEDFEIVSVTFEWVSMPCSRETPFGEFIHIQ